MTRPGLEPGPFYPESSALTIRPPPLQHIQTDKALLLYITTLLITGHFIFKASNTDKLTKNVDVYRSGRIISDAVSGGTLVSAILSSVSISDDKGLLIIWVSYDAGFVHLCPRNCGLRSSISIAMKFKVISFCNIIP